MIRHWCDAMGDENPVYTDPEFAEKSAHGGLVSPPTMLQAWTMPGLMRRGERSGSGGWNVLRILDEAGFTSVVATNCRQEYRRYLRPGDRLSATTSWADISDEKQTALGAGHFITQRVTYRDQNGEVVGTMDFRMLKFRPKAAPPPEAGTAKPEATQRTPRRPRPSSNQDTAFFWEGLREGRLRVRACAACGKLRHPPEPMCPSCGSLDWNLVDCSGRGHVYSFVVAHHPPVPPFAYPHVVALVELEEGVRIVAELAGVTREQVEIGMPVQAVFEPAAPDDDLVVPRFRPAGSQESRS
jgi:uncharacterized OB-fold protein/acyl dehydratase